jgi:hypothetical protein
MYFDVERRHWPAQGRQMVVLAVIEWCVDLEEPVLNESSVQLGRIWREHVEVSEPPAVRRVERSNLGPLEEQKRRVDHLTYAA